MKTEKEQDLIREIEEMKASQEKQMNIILDLTLRASAFERMLVEKEICTEEDIKKGLEEMGRELAGIVGLALLNAKKEAQKSQI